MDSRGLNQTEAGKVVGVAQSTIARWLEGAPVVKKIAELAGFLGVTVDEVMRMANTPITLSPANREPQPRPERMRSDVALPPSKVAPLNGAAKLPVYAAAQGGDAGMVLSSEPIDWIARPPQLADVKEAFAVYVINDSMVPKYKQGDTLLIHPGLPASTGDFVLVMLVDGAEHEYAAIVKQLVRRTAEHLVLAQLNPPREFTIEAAKVRAVHRIFGSFER